MFDPLAYPYVRAQTYVDPNPPEILAGEFYNPTQDALGRLAGAITGYTTSISSEEFLLQVNGSLIPAVNDPFGEELAVVNNTASAFTYASATPTSANQHGVYRIQGTVNGDRGSAPGFVVRDARRELDTMRWIFRARIRCSKHSSLAAGAGILAVGLGTYANAFPLWYSNGTGFWHYVWDGGDLASAIPTVDGAWVTFWITLRDADGIVRWYLKRDTDPLPLLVATRTLMTPSLTNVRRTLSYVVGPSAVAADFAEIDTISLAAGRTS